MDDLFGETEPLKLPTYPDWYTPSKERRVANLRVISGLHPLGGALGEGTCGECAHLRRREYSKTYLKCGVSRWTKGPASDVRAKWRGCSKFQEAT